MRWGISVMFNIPKSCLRSNRYYRLFRDLIEADAADELALSEELAQQHTPTS